MTFQRYTRSVLQRLQEEIPGPVKKRALLALAKERMEMASGEMIEVYLPLTQLLQRRISAVQALQAAAARALEGEHIATPYIIGLAGGVAAGKSTAAKLLQVALAAWPEHPDVALVNGDGFLFSNAELQQLGILDRKGFPESFDRDGLLAFLQRLKSGEPEVTAPVYSHVVYDVLSGHGQTIHAPDIVIIEGINVLQPHLGERDNDHRLASDFFDYAIYVHAEEAHIKQWFTERFMTLTEAAVSGPQSFYSRFAPLSPAQRLSVADYVWATINGKNLTDHILPTRPRADMILHKGADHRITHLELRNR